MVHIYKQICCKHSVRDIVNAKYILPEYGFTELDGCELSSTVMHHHVTRLGQATVPLFHTVSAASSNPYCKR